MNATNNKYLPELEKLLANLKEEFILTGSHRLMADIQALEEIVKELKENV